MPTTRPAAQVMCGHVGLSQGLLPASIKRDGRELSSKEQKGKGCKAVLHISWLDVQGYHAMAIWLTSSVWWYASAPLQRHPSARGPLAASKNWCGAGHSPAFHLSNFASP
jgi:hypothetical protein